MPIRRKSLGIVAVIFLAASVGCEADYYTHLVVGQIEVLNRTKPINDVLGGNTLTETERTRLILVKDVRRYGIDEIGLAENDAFTVYDANGTEPAAYVLSAAEKSRLVSYEWSFLFLGNAPYKGYFDKEMAKREAERLKADGYDVSLGGADGFSTLGFLPDPVRQSNLRLSEPELVELILHEMTHATVYKTGDADFNEAMATFVGRTAAQRYFIARHGAESDELKAGMARYDDEAVIDEFVVRLFTDAKAYYDAAAANGDDRETIIAGREAAFEASLASYETEFEPRLKKPDDWIRLRELKINNAIILGGVRYQAGLSDFTDVLAAAGDDFPIALQVFSDAADVADSRGYLRQWAMDH